MSPTKQEEYDASKDAFDPKTVYVAITEMQRYMQEFAGHVAVLEKAAYAAGRALEDVQQALAGEREKNLRLSAKLARWEATDVGSGA